MTGALQGRLGGFEIGEDGEVIPPTDKAFDLEFAQTSKWDGDQLVLISAFWDATLQAKQLGLSH